jgi:hypothetical protein
MQSTDAVSEVCRALSHPHRRVVLYYLREHDSASLETLAGCVTGWAQAGPGVVDEQNGYDRVRLRLHHSHLPVLSDVGYLTYDAGTVTATEIPNVAEEVLDTALRADVDETGVDPASVVRRGQ